MCLELVIGTMPNLISIILFNKENDGRSYEWIDINSALNHSKSSKFGIANYNAIKKI